MSGETVVLSCDVPPLHPTLWRAARDMVLGDGLPLSGHPRTIVLISRGPDVVTGGGRNIVNQDEVASELRALGARHDPPLRVVLYEHARCPGAECAIYTFAHARLVVGSHGGAFYNQLFVPEGAGIIEVMPTGKNGDVMHANPSNPIVWLQANVLGQSYWRIPTVPQDVALNMRVSLKKLRKAVEKELELPGEAPH